MACVIVFHSRRIDTYASYKTRNASVCDVSPTNKSFVTMCAARVLVSITRIARRKFISFTKAGSRLTHARGYEIILIILTFDSAAKFASNPHGGCMEFE